MDYQTLSEEQKQQGYLNRIAQLELEHFSNTVYIEECDTVGDTNSKQDFLAKNKYLEARIKYLLSKLETHEHQEPKTE